MEEDQPLHQPSDKLVKSTFSDAANAAGFFRAYIEPAVVSSVDGNSLRLENSSFVDVHLKGSESDLLFSANTPLGEAHLYLLFEHQSREDPWMALRLLRYMVRVWERKTATVKLAPSATLPPILPVVLAQDRSLWRKPPYFHSLFPEAGAVWDSLRMYTPDFRFRVVQLREMDFYDIHGTPGGVLGLRALKAWSSGDLLSDAVWDEQLMLQLPTEALQTLLRYIYSGEIDRDDFRRKVQGVRNFNLHKTTMTLEQQFREEGKREGKREGKLEGKLEGKREALLTVLESRFGVLPVGLREAIQATTGDLRLDAFFRQALGCPSLEEFSRIL